MENVTSTFISYVMAQKVNKNDVNGKNGHGIESKQTKRQLDLPHVAILHDSVLNGVQGEKIGLILWV